MRFFADLSFVVDQSGLEKGIAKGVFGFFDRKNICKKYMGISEKIF